MLMSASMLVFWGHKFKSCPQKVGDTIGHESPSSNLGPNKVHAYAVASWPLSSHITHHLLMSVLGELELARSERGVMAWRRIPLEARRRAPRGSLVANMVCWGRGVVCQREWHKKRKRREVKQAASMP